MEHYDYIIAGGGTAGLSLAHAFLHSPLRDKKILLVENDLSAVTGRAWCFLAKDAGIFDAMIERSWEKVHWAAPGFEQVLDLGEYRYYLVRGNEFSRQISSELAASENVRIVQMELGGIQDAAGVARVEIEGKPVSAFWAFDSILRNPEDVQKFSPSQVLVQHVLTWELETKHVSFNLDVPTIADFRAEQKNGLCFLRLIPLSERRAMVSYHQVTTDVVPGDRAEDELTLYLQNIIKIPTAEMQILKQNYGKTILTDYPFSRRDGFRVMNIGEKAGRIHPVFGFAFERFQEDNSAIIKSLIEKYHPFHAKSRPSRLRFYERVLLRILSREKDAVPGVIARIIARNPVERILRLFNEETSPGEEIRLLLTLPVWTLFRAALDVLLFDIKNRN